VISCVGIVVYRGLYFGMYDSLKPVLLVGTLEVHNLNPPQLCHSSSLSSFPQLLKHVFDCTHS
jgi:hypothetical protein